MDLLETSHMLLLVKGAYGYAAPEYIITGITLLETLPKEFTWDYYCMDKTSPNLDEGRIQASMGGNCLKLALEDPVGLESTIKLFFCSNLYNLPNFIVNIMFYLIFLLNSYICSVVDSSYVLSVQNIHLQGT